MPLTRLYPLYFEIKSGSTSNIIKTAIVVLARSGSVDEYGIMYGADHDAMGSGILFSYPELATLAGLQGVIVYAISSACPLLIFAALAPIIRRKCPEGFVLTEWARQRYGIITALYLGALTLLTLFLYMVAELSAIGQVVTVLTGLDGLPVVIVECVVTTVYTSLGGFKISFITDNIQGAMICALIIIATITIGARTDIKPDLVDNSGLLDSSLVGWQLIYILPVAILTNDFFLANYWLRAFASRTDRDLWIGVSVAMVVILIVLTLVGCTGLIAVWSGAWPGDPPTEDGSVAFFLLLEKLPSWVVGIVLLMSVCLSTAAFDSLQSAMVSSASNDVFRNRLNIWWIRGAVVLIIVPTVVLAVKAPSILQIYLISDLLSAATIPVLMVGLSERFYWWRGFEVLVGGLGGILSVFIFGTIYYESAQLGAELILLEQGLYTGDWGAFGAFVVAPIGGLIFGLIALAVRLTFQYVESHVRGTRFDAFEHPARVSQEEQDALSQEAEIHHEVATSKVVGKFF
ncbi:Uu.00g113110.m01.CDS01 [Anthostomella pinea]|uniref:Uu.00g113110.m01.CDS01 n=1 Tax=Anthostomella pinea TaxID=933095 RepID=A0AAI8YGN2_9PEZI|nr:Uu.00g113110.m01.CDS01 [Anthostomella pinea]